MKRLCRTVIAAQAQSTVSPSQPWQTGSSTKPRLYNRICNSTLCLPITVLGPTSDHSLRPLSKNMRNRQEQTCSTIVSSSSCKVATLRIPSTPFSKSEHKRSTSFVVTTENSSGGSGGLSMSCIRYPPAVFSVQQSVWYVGNYRPWFTLCRALF
jgi:hypothetical protein